MSRVSGTSSVEPGCATCAVGASKPVTAAASETLGAHEIIAAQQSDRAGRLHRCVSGESLPA
jgi:hypothetical protein